jgi:hypothetical protein
LWLWPLLPEPSQRDMNIVMLLHHYTKSSAQSIQITCLGSEHDFVLADCAALQFTCSVITAIPLCHPHPHPHQQGVAPPPPSSTFPPPTYALFAGTTGL